MKTQSSAGCGESRRKCSKRSDNVGWTVSVKLGRRFRHASAASTLADTGVVEVVARGTVELRRSGAKEPRREGAACALAGSASRQRRCIGIDERRSRRKRCTRGATPLAASGASAASCSRAENEADRTHFARLAVGAAPRLCPVPLLRARAVLGGRDASISSASISTMTSCLKRTGNLKGLPEKLHPPRAEGSFSTSDSAWSSSSLASWVAVGTALFARLARVRLHSVALRGRSGTPRAIPPRRVPFAAATSAQPALSVAPEQAPKSSDRGRLPLGLGFAGALSTAALSRVGRVGLSTVERVGFSNVARVERLADARRRDGTTAPFGAASAFGTSAPVGVDSSTARGVSAKSAAGFGAKSGEGGRRCARSVGCGDGDGKSSRTNKSVLRVPEKQSTPEPCRCWRCSRVTRRSMPSSHGDERAG
eukprot:1929301-Pleurochrysis_carterae.AAC.1